jgi:Na+-driven multidrug efflux pump
MRFPAAVIVLGEVLHLMLASSLIFGFGPFPALGIRGAALSLVTSYVLRATALGAYLLTGRSAVRLAAAGQASWPWSALRRRIQVAYGSSNGASNGFLVRAAGSDERTGAVHGANSTDANSAGATSADADSGKADLERSRVWDRGLARAADSASGLKWNSAGHDDQDGQNGARGSSGRIVLRWRYFADILRVGLPGAVNTLLTNVTVAAVTGVVGTFGTAALAGYGLGARLEYLQIPLVFGFGTALVTLVGTNVGAGQIARARRIAWTGAGLAAAITGSIGLLVALAPGLWLGLFTSSPPVLAVGATYLRMVGPVYGMFGLGLALYFAAQGAGRLLGPLLAGVARLLVALIGSYLAVYVLDVGLMGVFGAIALSFVVFGVAQAWAVSRALRPASRGAAH